MDIAELKKNVFTNLRSVTQSCKGGVPFHRLQQDYRAFIGSDIPFKSFGFSSLECFIQSIPSVVRLKMINGSCMVEGVVDSSTAHIASMISKQKNSKSGILQKPVSGNKNSGNEKKHNIPPVSQVSVKVQEQNDPKIEDLKKAVLINLRGVTLSKKDGVLLQNLQRDYSYFIGTKIPFEILGYDSLENFLRSIPNVINLKMNNARQLVAVAVPDASTAHIASLISQQKQARKKKKIAATKTAKKKVPTFQAPQRLNESMESVSSTSQSSSSLKENASRSSIPQEAEKNIRLTPELSKEIPRSSIPQEAEKNIKLTPELSKEIPRSSIPQEAEKKIKLPAECLKKNPNEHDTTKAENSFICRSKTLGSFPCIKNNIVNGHFSTLMGLYNLLYGVSYMDILKDEILKFGGYLFQKDSKEWKKREFLFSVLPADGLKEYLNLLCVDHCDTEDKHILLNKLLHFVAFPLTEMIDPKKETPKECKWKSPDSDLYKKCYEKDKQIYEIMQENKNLKAELSKIKNDFKKSLEERSLQSSTDSKLQYLGSNKEINVSTEATEIKNLKSEIKNLEAKLTAAVAKTKEKEKEKGKMECELNTLKHERKVEIKEFEQQKSNLLSNVGNLVASLTAAAAKTKETEKEKGKLECELNTLKHERNVEKKEFEQQTKNLKSEIKNLEAKLTAAVAKTKVKEKEKGKIECELNTLRHERKVEIIEFEQQKGKMECELNTLKHERKDLIEKLELQKLEFMKYIKSNSTSQDTKKKVEQENAAKIKQIEIKVSWYENMFNQVKDLAKLLESEIASRPAHYTTILPLLHQLFRTLNEANLQTSSQQPLPSS